MTPQSLLLFDRRELLRLAGIGSGLAAPSPLDKLARGYETYLKSRMLERDDAATMRRMVPGWKRTLF